MSVIKWSGTHGLLSVFRKVLFFSVNVCVIIVMVELPKISVFGMGTTVTSVPKMLLNGPVAPS